MSYAGRRPGQLTPREKQMRDMVAEGATDKEIAFRLGVSQQTVKNTLRTARIWVGASNRLRLVLLTMPND